MKWQQWNAATSKLVEVDRAFVEACKAEDQGADPARLDDAAEEQAFAINAVLTPGIHARRPPPGGEFMLAALVEQVGAALRVKVGRRAPVGLDQAERVAATEWALAARRELVEGWSELGLRHAGLLGGEE